MIIEKIKTISIFFLICSILIFLSDKYSVIGYPLWFMGVGLWLITSTRDFGMLLKDGIILWFLLFSFFALISTIYSDFSEQGQKLLFFVNPQQLVLLLAVCSFCTSHQKIRELIFIYLIVSVILALIVIYDGPESIGQPRYGWSTTGNQPNTPALNLAPAFAFSYYFFSYTKNFKVKILNVALMLLFAVTIFLTGSRKIVLYMIGIVILFSFYRSTNLKKMIKTYIIMIIFFLGLYYVLTENSMLVDTIGERLFNLDSDDSNAERTELRSLAFSYFMENPILGNGIDSFQHNNRIGLYAHNNYLEILCGLGLLGFFIYYSYLFFLTKKLYETRKKDNMNFLFFSVILMTFVIEYYNVNYIQRGVFIIYALVYCQYKTSKKSVR